MKRLLSQPKIFGYLLALVLPGFLAGCARTPSGSNIITVREMSFRIDFNGPINDGYYYYIPIDITGEGLGPVPIFPNSNTLSGWVTGSATHFIQYHAGQYEVYQITNLQPFAAVPIGSPLRVTIPTAGSQSLEFTINLNTLNPDPNASSIDVNFIAIDQPLSSTRLLDGLGPLGTDFLNINIQSNRVYTNSDSLIPEAPNDVLDQNRTIQPSNEITKPLDIVNWSITVNM